jgi:hypothetical protein
MKNATCTTEKRSIEFKAGNYIVVIKYDDIFNEYSVFIFDSYTNQMISNFGGFSTFAKAKKCAISKIASLNNKEILREVSAQFIVKNLK